MSTQELLTTSEAAERLGVTRQTIVNMCAQGRLGFIRVGTHRRVPRDEVESVANLRRGWKVDGHQRSLALHALVVSELLRRPDEVLAKARDNLSTFPEDASVYRERWESLLNGPLPDLIAAMLDTSDTGVTLRSSTPFAGVLSDEDRGRVREVYR